MLFLFLSGFQIGWSNNTADDLGFMLGVGSWVNYRSKQPNPHIKVELIKQLYLTTDRQLYPLGQSLSKRLGVVCKLKSNLIDSLVAVLVLTYTVLDLNMRYDGEEHRPALCVTLECLQRTVTLWLVHWSCSCTKQLRQWAPDQPKNIKCFRSQCVYALGLWYILRYIGRRHT